ncbi:dienelactone hydrolase family protein [Actinomadura macra]|uniref:dienelactone hydrolase family protein n=1 Tax=Actinomadura macra TaxID=46164 RepID=UPI000833809A|nr:dienelactone hydrolase family protein [Actinomadura macra]
MHAAESDQFAPPERVARMIQAAGETGADPEIFRYLDAGHFYTGHHSSDYTPSAAELTWGRVLDFLGQIH